MHIYLYRNKQRGHISEILMKVLYKDDSYGIHYIKKIT